MWPLAMALANAGVAVALPWIGSVADRIGAGQWLRRGLLVALIWMVLLALALPWLPQLVGWGAVVIGKVIFAVLDLLAWTLLAQRQAALAVQRAVPRMALASGLGGIGGAVLTSALTQIHLGLAFVGVALSVIVAAVWLHRLQQQAPLQMMRWRWWWSVLAAHALPQPDTQDVGNRRRASVGLGVAPGAPVACRATLTSPHTVWGSIHLAWRAPVVRAYACFVFVGGGVATVAYASVGIIAQAQLPHTTALVHWLALVRIASQAAALLAQIVLTPRCLPRLGAGSGAVVTPAVLTALAGVQVVLAASGSPNVLLAAGVIAVAAKAADAGVQTPIDKLIAGLVPSALRARAVALWDGPAKRLGSVMVGAGLACTTTPRALALLLVAASVAWLAVALWWRRNALRMALGGSAEEIVAHDLDTTVRMVAPWWEAGHLSAPPIWAAGWAQLAERARTAPWPQRVHAAELLLRLHRSDARDACWPLWRAIEALPDIPAAVALASSNAKVLIATRYRLWQALWCALSDGQPRTALVAEFDTALRRASALPDHERAWLWRARSLAGAVPGQPLRAAVATAQAAIAEAMHGDDAAWTMPQTVIAIAHARLAGTAVAWLAAHASRLLAEAPSVLAWETACELTRLHAVPHRARGSAWHTALSELVQLGLRVMRRAARRVAPPQEAAHHAPPSAHDALAALHADAACAAAGADADCADETCADEAFAQLAYALMHQAAHWEVQDAAHAAELVLARASLLAWRLETLRAASAPAAWVCAALRGLQLVAPGAAQGRTRGLSARLPRSVEIADELQDVVLARLGDENEAVAAVAFAVVEQWGAHVLARLVAVLHLGNRRARLQATTLLAALTVDTSQLSALVARVALTLQATVQLYQGAADWAPANQWLQRRLSERTENLVMELFLLAAARVGSGDLAAAARNIYGQATEQLVAQVATLLPEVIPAPLAQLLAEGSGLPLGANRVSEAAWLNLVATTDDALTKSLFLATASPAQLAQVRAAVQSNVAGSVTLRDPNELLQRVLQNAPMPSLIETVMLLGELSLFASAGPGQLHAVARRGTWQRVAAGTVVWPAETHLDALVLIGEGRIQYAGALLQRGASLDELAPFVGGATRDAVVVVEECQLWTLSKAQLWRALDDVPGLAAAVCTQLAHQLTQNALRNKTPA